MKKINRLKSNEDFTTTIKNGLCYRNPSFKVYFLKNDNFIRIGISVPTKFGTAVIRVRVRRQIRAMLDKIVNFNETHGDVVIVVGRKYADLTYQENFKQLSDCFEKIGNN